MMKKNKKLILVGAGEFALIAYEYFTFDSEFEVVAFSVEKDFINQTQLCNIPVLPFEEIELLFNPNEYFVYVAIPASQLNRLRKRLYFEAKSKGYRFASYISSRAFVWHNSKIGENTFIFENNTIQPFVEIGNNVILWSGNHIGHRSVIHDHCFLSSHVVVSGYCTIEQSCFLGVNSTLNDHVFIAEDSLIASGTLVNKSIHEKGKVYYGSPRKQLVNKESIEVEL